MNGAPARAFLSKFHVCGRHDPDLPCSGLDEQTFQGQGAGRLGWRKRQATHHWRGGGVHVTSISDVRKNPKTFHSWIARRVQPCPLALPSQPGAASSLEIPKPKSLQESIDPLRSRKRPKHEPRY